MSGKAKPRVLLVIPVGEGVGGMICQANALVAELAKQQKIDFMVIDSAQRYRAYHDLSFLSRAWGGGGEAVKRIRQLLAALMKFRPVAVRIGSSASWGLVRDVVLVALVRLFRVKVFVSLHFGRIPELASQRNWEWRLLGTVVRMATGVQVLDSRSLEVLRNKFPKRSIHQFPNAVDCDWIDQIRGRVHTVNANRAVPHFVFVGMVIPSKGVVELVEACSRIRAMEFELEMVGPVGPEMKAQLCGIAANRGAGRWLKFSGALARETAIERVAAADVFVLPSYTEGFPGSVLEAMACRVAIVATSVGAIPEMLLGDDGMAVGLVVPPRDTGSLQLALEDLLQNPAKRLVLGAAARRKCEAHYRLPDLARRWVELWTSRRPGDR